MPSTTQSGNTVIRGVYGIFNSGEEIRTAAPLQLAYNLSFFYEPQFISDRVIPAITVSQISFAGSKSGDWSPRDQRGFVLAHSLLSDVEPGGAELAAQCCQRGSRTVFIKKRDSPA
jgi:hypothetical protein